MDLLTVVIGRYAVFGGGLITSVSACVSNPHPRILTGHYSLQLITINVTVTGAVDIWDSASNTWLIVGGELAPARYDGVAVPWGSDAVIFAGALSNASHFTNVA